LKKKKQKRTFFRSIGRRDETLFQKERLLEKTISKLILTCPKEQRAAAYREAYNELHKFMMTVVKGEHLYKDANLHRAMWKQKLIYRIRGKNQRVLEVGCGEGLLSIALSKLGNQVTGIDVSDLCISLAKKNKLRFAATKVNFLRMNATKLDFPPSTFDLVISVDMLEHLHPDDVRYHLLESARVLRPKGRYFLITPNAYAGIHAGSTHLKEYTFEELKVLLAHAGFTIKAPLLPYISPLNVLVNVEVKLLFQKLFDNTSSIYPMIGLDPIVLMAFNQKQD